MLVEGNKYLEKWFVRNEPEQLAIFDTNVCIFNLFAYFMKLIILILFLLSIQTKIFCQYKGAIQGHTKLNASIDIFRSLDTSKCTGDYNTLKFFDASTNCLIIGDTICKEETFNPWYVIFNSGSMYFTAKSNFKDVDKVDSFLLRLKKEIPNIKDRFNEINVEFQKAEKIRIAEEENEKAIQKAEEERQKKIQDEKDKRELDSLQKQIDKVLAIYRNKNWVLWEWSWNYPNEYSKFADVSIDVINPYKSKIKYISFTIKAFNPVGDVVRDGISRATSKTVRGVGPIEYGDHGLYNFESVIYSSVIEKMQIIQIKIQFFDGTTKIITNPIQIHHENSD